MKEKRTRILFVRHAEAEGNLNRIFHGWTDSELTEKGHIQAEKVAERLKPVDIDVIYSSSLKRALQTAGYISRVKNLPIIRTDRLKEINGGDWENKRWDVLPELWPEEYRTWEYEPHNHKMPNGESMHEFQARLIDEIHCIVNQHKGKNICIVTHGTAIRALLCHFYGCRPDEMQGIAWHDNTSITIVDYIDGSFHVVCEGDNSHLGPDLSTIDGQEWWKEYRKRVKGGNRFEAGQMG